MNNTHTPLISCICITGHRPLLLQRAIACFDSQDYPLKELVISYPDDDFVSRDLLKQIEEISNIKMVKIERSELEKLGTARNNAIALANGEFICIWDDDDWFDHTRISSQFTVLKNGPFKASVLLNVLLYDALSDKTYYSDFREFGGTLLCEKEILLETSYPDLGKGEDNSIIQYLTYRNVLFRIIEMPHLYIYVYHGNNTLGERYFNLYFTLNRVMDEGLNSQVRNIINLDQYDIIQ